mmetsp:Transcript_25511/g.75834  ORF Transcript_25511/g.75834 Transcript_25511/m.75834 type:complete len:232 (-) Transcript_25511:719-1414(-)
MAIPRRGQHARSRELVPTHRSEVKRVERVRPGRRGLCARRLSRPQGYSLGAAADRAAPSSKGEQVISSQPDEAAALPPKTWRTGEPLPAARARVEGKELAAGAGRQRWGAPLPGSIGGLERSSPPARLVRRASSKDKELTASRARCVLRPRARGLARCLDCLPLQHGRRSLSAFRPTAVIRRAQLAQHVQLSRVALGGATKERVVYPTASRVRGAAAKDEYGAEQRSGGVA